MFIEKFTEHLPLGYFWCEWFEGRHLSIDYYKGEVSLVVEGHKSEDTFTKWSKWEKVNDYIEFPKILKDFKKKKTLPSLLDYCDMIKKKNIATLPFTFLKIGFSKIFTFFSSAPFFILA